MHRFCHCLLLKIREVRVKKKPDTDITLNVLELRKERSIQLRSPMRLVQIFLVISIVFAIGACGSDKSLNESSILPCSDKPNCVSSKSFQPDKVIWPISFGASMWPQAKERLLKVLKSFKRCRIITLEEDYIHAEFTSAVFRFKDDVEFLADHKNKVIQVRAAARLRSRDFGENRKRVETIRTMMESMP